MPEHASGSASVSVASSLTRCTIPTGAASGATSGAGGGAAPVWQPGGDAPWAGAPFAVSLGGPVGAEAGQPAALKLQVAQSGGPSQQAVLATPLHLTVCIYKAKNLRQPGAGARWVEDGAPVWQFTPQPLTAVKPGWGAVLNFTWDARDAHGHPVPPGLYFADLVFPPTLNYKVGGTPAEETLPTAPLTAQGQYYLAPVFIGAPNAPYPQDPRIEALASQMNTTIYVPADAPGHPAVVSATPFAPPPLPGVPPSNALHAMITVGQGGSGFGEVLITAPSTLPSGCPDEQSTKVAIAGGTTAVACQSAAGYSYLQGHVTDYSVTMDIGNLALTLETSSYSEAQLIAIAKTLTAVPAVEPS